MAELIPISFERLLKRMYFEYDRKGAIFDLPVRKFYHPNPELDLRVSFCGNVAANPAGPAAGPQTQLAQNIVLSWLAGARIIELKTVQINDRLQLSRPCIDMATVGYNTEWSQELRLEESLREYVKASMMIEMLQRSFQDTAITFHTNPGQLETSNSQLETVLDISIGYDLAGIQSREIRSWLQRIRNAGDLIDEYRNEIPHEFAAYRDLPFKSEIGNSITLSTFHGTPANEIERICEFLIEEMDFHVVIKMNPPMLGKERLEYLLHETLGYHDVEVNQKAFDVNITFADAVDVVRRLQRVAHRREKTIGVKFGNTLEVLNKGSFLKDKVQYLSGQPLHVLHLVLVDEWRNVFGGEFPISFSAGVDAQNFADCVSTGLVPITTCTDLLREGGYGRLQRYLLNLEKRMKELGATIIDDFIRRTAVENSAIANPQSEISNLQSAILFNTSDLLQKTLANPRYRAEQNRRPPRKIGRHLHLWDCINCDKCIPVCPNDANFFFEIVPFETQYKNVEIDGASWREVEGGVLSVKESHQIGTFADACNECGNCDVFCPEDGGPYIEKPRFFGSVDSWRKWNSLDGFVLAQENGEMVLYGRMAKKEYRLAIQSDQRQAKFRTDTVLLDIDWTSGKVLNAASDALSAVHVDMGHYLTMAALLRGISNTSRINFINCGAQLKTLDEN